jgi:hypothetical protein
MIKLINYSNIQSRYILYTKYILQVIVEFDIRKKTNQQSLNKGLEQEHIQIDKSKSKYKRQSRVHTTNVCVFESMFKSAGFR